jgi:hypothetical protein
MSSFSRVWPGDDVRYPIVRDSEADRHMTKCNMVRIK